MDEENWLRNLGHPEYNLNHPLIEEEEKQPFEDGEGIYIRRNQANQPERARMRVWRAGRVITVYPCYNVRLKGGPYPHTLSSLL